MMSLGLYWFHFAVAMETGVVIAMPIIPMISYITILSIGVVLASRYPCKGHGNRHNSYCCHNRPHSHVSFRSLGDFDYKKVESRGPTEQLVSPDPEITVIEKASDDDQLIILACDGVWDVMTNEELGEFVINRCQRVPDLSKVAEEVIDYCLYKGSRDNMSVIIITTKNAPTVDPELQSRDAKLNELIKAKVRGE